MSDEAWKEEYKEWKALKPFQVKLLDEGAQSLSQTWLLNSMWCDWKDIKRLKEAELTEFKPTHIEYSHDLWRDLDT